MIDRRTLFVGSATFAAAGLSGRALAAPIKPDAASALIVVDVQNCFLPGGSLAVKDGDKVVPVINRLAKSFANIVCTQDWHTPGHVSFASSHQGKKPFDVVKLGYGDQVLWPDHCVQGTEGAALAKDLDLPRAQLVIRKGFHQDVDSYSALLEADNEDRTRRLSEGAQGQDALRDRSRDRLLRGVDGDRCAQGGVQRLCGRGRLPRHRRQRFAGEGMGRHDQGRRPENPVVGRGLSLCRNGRTRRADRAVLHTSALARRSAACSNESQSGATRVAAPGG